MRVVIVEQDAEDRAMLTRVMSDLGDEVVAATGPEFCQAYQLQRGYCPLDAPCYDLKIINQHAIPRISGVKFVDWQRRCGCKIPVHHSALMSAAWTAKELRMMKRLGVTTLIKPFMIKELVGWIYQIKNARRKGSAN